MTRATPPRDGRPSGGKTPVSPTLPRPSREERRLSAAEVEQRVGAVTDPEIPTLSIGDLLSLIHI